MTTVEGLARDGELSVLQRAFIEHHGLQCGYCTPGMLTTLTEFLRDHPDPSEAEVRLAISRQPVPLHRVYRNRARRTRCCKDPAGARRMTGFGGALREDAVGARRVTGSWRPP